MQNEPTTGGAVDVRVTGRAGNTPGNGPFLHVTLGVSNGLIGEAAYETYQCPACHDCGKAVCAMAMGKRVEEARDIKYQALVERVGPLPQNRSGCYGLAVLALSDALEQIEKLARRAAEGPPR